MLGIGFVGWLLVLYIGITSAFAAQCVDDFCWMFPKCPKIVGSLFMFVFTFIVWVPILISVVVDAWKHRNEGVSNGSKRKHQQG